jgi:RND family efflux transporter MFP subunit
MILSLAGASNGRSQTTATRQAAPRQESAIEVVVRRVQQTSRPTSIAVSGEVEGRRTVNIGFKVAGVVASVLREEGDVVTAGDVIAELEKDGYELGLQMASAGADRARDAFARAKKMSEQGGMPPADFVQIETGVRQAIAQESLARKQVTDTRLIAPISGVVARRGVQPAEQVAAGMPVFTIIAVDPVEARVGVPESAIGMVRVGQAADIRIPSLNQASFSGRVRVVGVAADPVSRTYSVRIAVPNPNRVLRPGMIADVSITDGKATRTLTLPGEAILHDADGAALVYVFEAADNRVRSRRVQVGSVFGKEVEITSGLAGNEMVVVGGQHRLRTGALVKARVVSGTLTPRVGN